VLSDRSKQWPVIHGVVGNKPITRLDCAAVRSTSYWIGTEIAEQEIRASKAFLGVLLKEPDGQLFSEMTIVVRHRLPGPAVAGGGHAEFGRFRAARHCTLDGAIPPGQFSMSATAPRESKLPSCAAISDSVAKGQN
jgi:hypothetical protein